MELTANDFRPASCQPSVFTPDHDFSSAKLMRVFYPTVDWLDAEPVVVPAPPGIPAEIPRVVLAAKSGEWRCEVAPARLNFFWFKTEEEKSIVLGEFFARALEVLEQYNKVAQTRVARLASVLTRFVQHNKPGHFIARHFCRAEWTDGPFKDVGDFELHAHERFRLEKFEVNSWSRSKAGFMQNGAQKKLVLLVEQDINTLAESMGEAAFGREDRELFFKSVAPRFDRILNSLYPGSQGTTIDAD